MKIHQIFINDTNILPEKLPKFHNACYEQIKKIYPDSEYHLYCGEEIEELIKNNFDKDVLLSYKKLKPYACKADLARLCILYLYGGLYIDLNVYFINPIPNLNGLDFFAFRDQPKASVQSWAVHNGIIYSSQKIKILEKAIDLIKIHCKKEYYGVSSIDVSATTVLGKAITLSITDLNSIPSGRPFVTHLTNGQLQSISQKYLNKKLRNKFKNMGYLTNKVPGFVMDVDNRLIAVKKPSLPGDIISMGFQQTNNYHEMWLSLNVYNTSNNKSLIYD